MTLRQKLVTLFAVTSCVIVLVNIFTYAMISRMMGRVEDVYISNINLNDLSDGLDELQLAMTAYLRTKSSDAMGDFFRKEQDYRELIDTLNRQPTDNEVLLTEKNILNFPKGYVRFSSIIIQMKSAID